MRPQPYTQEDFSVNPLMFYYEVTQACDLVCKHCRASAQETAAPDELPTETALALLEDVARFPRKPTICFTGGDPLKRADLFDLIRHATELGIGSALTPSATPLATFDAFKKAKEAGVSAIGISIDGPNPEVHDAFRGFDGSFNKARHASVRARSGTARPGQYVDYAPQRRARRRDRRYARRQRDHDVVGILPRSGRARRRRDSHYAPGIPGSLCETIPAFPDEALLRAHDRSAPLPPIRHGTGRLADSRAEEQAEFSEFRVCRRNEDAADGKQGRR